MQTLRRLKDTGVAELLGTSALFAAVAWAYSSGMFSPPKAGTLVHKLIETPTVSAGLACLILGASAVLLTCKPFRVPIYRSFFAGVLVGVGLTSALFFDAWLATILFGIAVRTFHTPSPVTPIGLHAAQSQPNDA